MALRLAAAAAAAAASRTDSASECSSQPENQPGAKSDRPRRDSNLRVRAGEPDTTPLVSSAELLVAQKAGVNAAKAYHDWRTLKPHLTAIVDLTKLIGNGATTGYTILGYLAARGTTPNA